MSIAGQGSRARCLVRCTQKTKAAMLVCRDHRLPVLSPLLSLHLALAFVSSSAAACLYRARALALLLSFSLDLSLPLSAPQIFLTYPACCPAGVGMFIHRVCGSPDLKQLGCECRCRWQSLVQIIDHWGAWGKELAKWAGPGHYHDPDMLLLGNGCLTHAEEQTQMALWSISASAPLFPAYKLVPFPHPRFTQRAVPRANRLAARPCVGRAVYTQSRRRGCARTMMRHVRID